MEKKRKNKYLFLIVTSVSVIFVLSVWFINYSYGMKLDHIHSGIFGDMFGAVNAVFSGLAFAGIIISLYFQRIDLKNQFKEIKQTNREFKIQNETMQIQKFENQYYKMIDLHKKNVDELVIPYDNTKELKGKKCFVDMFKELEYVISELKEFSKCLTGSDISDSDIEKFAYKVFFFGRNSELIKTKGISDKELESFKDHLKSKYSAFVNSGRKIVNPKIRYNPFQGHESRLAHYYRHLFQTVKYVVQQEEKELICYEETRQYLRVLRSQLSNAEQLLLYYNYYCGFGVNWDKLGDRNYQFLTKYRMIHNLPLDRVKSIESPESHFRDFISQHNDLLKDPLFEWHELTIDG